MNWHTQLFQIWLSIPAFVALTLICVAPGVRDGVRGLWRGLARLAARGRAAPFVAIGIAVAIMGTIPPVLGWIQPPWIHDELANLLAGETFLHGRLTNPTPPVADAFQTMHVLMRPTYMSKFPPGQGLALAAGMLVGSARVAPIASLALASIATAWALRAVMSRRWALVAGLLAGIHPAMFQWSQSFWGGGVAMIGGALLAGAALRADTQVRLRRGVNGSLGLIAGVGLAILANTRPFEGAIVAVLFAVALVIRAARSGVAWRALLEALVRPSLLAACVLVPVFAWMGYYNYRVTGSALRMPYTEHARQYMREPIFWWQRAPNPPRNPAKHIRMFYDDFEVKEFETQDSLGGALRGVGTKLSDVGVTAFEPLVLAAILFAGGFRSLRRHRSARLAVFICVGLIVVHFASTPWFRTHYLAVVAPMFILLLTATLRDGAAIVRQKLRIARDLPLAAAAAIALLIVMAISSLLDIHWLTLPKDTLAHLRLKFIEVAQKQPGKHLIIVTYARGPQSIYEWVYNPADLDSARVIFAHDVGAQRNTELRDHFPDRSIWLLIVENQELKFRPVLYRRKPGELEYVPPPVTLPEQDD